MSWRLRSPTLCPCVSPSSSPCVHAPRYSAGVKSVYRNGQYMAADRDAARDRRSGHEEGAKEGGSEWAKERRKRERRR